jgi:hypothetical protein
MDSGIREERTYHLRRVVLRKVFLGLKGHPWLRFLGLVCALEGLFAIRWLERNYFNLVCAQG